MFRLSFQHSLEVEWKFSLKKEKKKKERKEKLTPVSLRSPYSWPGWRRCSKRRIAISSSQEPRNEPFQYVFPLSCSRSLHPPLDTAYKRRKEESIVLEITLW